MTSKNLVLVVLLALILFAGIFLRVHHTAANHTLGSDENTYLTYLVATKAVGVGNYGEIVKAYESNQAEPGEVAIVHPLRMAFILASYCWMEIFKCRPLAALHAVAAFAAVLHLFVAGIFAWRAGGRSALLGVLALVACAPLQICLAQLALVDGVYGFEATLCFWLLWENLRAPNHWAWLIAYVLALFLLVMTKEYSAFVVFAFCGVIVLNRWLGFGTVTPKLLVATVAGPAMAVVVLMYYVGGISNFIHFYLLFVEKSRVLDYAIKTQDGPWCRYLLDFIIISPAVAMLAVGRIFQLQLKNRADLYCAVFLLFSYVSMSNVTYGMSLRFAAFWDVPMCWLAFSQLNALVERFALHRKVPVLVLLTILVCGIELREYSRIFVESVTPHPIYDPITVHLLEANKMVK